MHRYGNDFRWGRSAGGGGPSGYDMEFGNWGARSGLDSGSGWSGGRSGSQFGGGWAGGGPRPGGAQNRYDAFGRLDRGGGGYGGYGGHAGYGGPRDAGSGIRVQGTSRGSGGYDGRYRFEPRSGPGGYDRSVGGHDRGYGGGFGMAGLHEQMMRGRGEGFGYAGDYHRTHPIHPDEVGGGRGRMDVRGRPGGGRWRGW